MGPCYKPDAANAVSMKLLFLQKVPCLSLGCRIDGRQRAFANPQDQKFRGLIVRQTIVKVSEMFELCAVGRARMANPFPLAN
jgi:hypothetical protein